MNQQDRTPGDKPEPDEAKIQRLLTHLETAGHATAIERDRISAAMWAELDQGQNTKFIEPEVALRGIDYTISGDEVAVTSQRRPRLLLWAAILLLAAGILGVAQIVGDQTIEPLASPDELRATIQVGDTRVSFDTLPGYKVDLGSAGQVTLTAEVENTRTHQLITVVQATEVFDGREADEFFAAEGLLPEPAVAPEGSTAFFVSVDSSSGCVIGQPCLPIAKLPGGEPLELVAGTYARIEVYENPGSDPIVVVSEVGGSGNGPALVNVQLSR